MSLFKKIINAANSRFCAFVDLMLGVCGIAFFFAGVQWERQWMSVAVIAAIYIVGGMSLAVNFAYALTLAIKGDSIDELKHIKAFRAVHAVTAFFSFAVAVYGICILFGVGGGISSEEIDRAVEAVRPIMGYIIFALAIGVSLVFCNGKRQTAKAFVATAACTVVVALIFELLTTPAVSLVTPDMSAEKINLSGRELLWSDEFEGDKLDETKWRVFDDDVHTTYYTPEQVSVKDGCAYLKTEYIKGGKYGDGFYGAWLSTENSFKNSYGYYEVRCIMPKAEGLHAAFWTFADSHPYSGYGKTGAEIDIFENAYYRVDSSDEKANCTYSMAIHTGDDEEKVFSYGLPHVTTYTNDGKNMYEDFHTYGLEWTKDAYIFYYDGVEVGRADFTNGEVGGIVGTCETPEFLYLSTHVGSLIRDDGSVRTEWNGNAFNNPEGTFPQNFVVDYVRVYAPAQ